MRDNMNYTSELDMGGLLVSKSEFNERLTQYLQFSYLYFLLRFKLGYTHVSIIAHSDFDGFISAAIVFQKYPHCKVYFATARNLHKVLYISQREAPKGFPHKIFILDLRVSELYFTRILKAIRDIRHKALVDITWIDHHHSPCIDQLQEYLSVYIDPSAPHTAFLVQKQVNNTLESIKLLDLLHNSRTAFTEYWRPVIRAVLKMDPKDNSRTIAVRHLATHKQTEFTNKLRIQGLNIKEDVAKSQTSDKIFRLDIYWTKQNWRFGIIKFYKEVDLYSEVQRKLNLYNLDFIIVQFDDENFSAYKGRFSTIDMTPFFQLVGGKGHTYAFHFEPQIRISDEFFRPTTINDLIKKIQELY